MTLVPLKRLATVRVSNVDKKSVEDEIPVRMCNYTDVYYRDEIAPNQEFMSATASSAQISMFRLRPHDVIITKDSETAEDIGVPSYVRAGAPDLICGYHLAIVRPDPRVLDGRFLYWFMASTTARQQLSLAATGVTRFGLRADSTGGMLVASCAIDRQRAIADYLDTETARIDALISKKRRLIETSQEREAANLTAAWQGAADRWGVSALRRRLAHMEQGWSPQCEDRLAEPPALGVMRAGCVNGGRFRPGEHKALPTGTSPRLEYLLRAGDLLVSRASGSLDLIGSAAVVPADTPSNLLLCDKVYRLTVDDQTEATFVAMMLRANPVREVIRLGVSGGEGMANNLPSGVVRDLPIPSAPLREQRAIVSRIQALEDRNARLVGRLNASIGVLSEHRQALITAAVTGELEIPGAP